MVQTGFAGTVGEGFERRHAQAIHGADVYDTGGGAVGSRGFEEGSEGLGEGEDAVEV